MYCICGGHVGQLVRKMPKSLVRELSLLVLGADRPSIKGTFVPSSIRGRLFYNIDVFIFSCKVDYTLVFLKSDSRLLKLRITF